MNLVTHPDAVIQLMFALTGIVLVFGSLLMFVSFFGYIGLMLYKYRDREKRSLDSVLLQVAMPRDNEIKIDAAEQMFAAFYSLRKHYSTFMTMQPHISFEMVGRPGDIRFYVHVPNKYRDLVEK